MAAGLAEVLGDIPIVASLRCVDMHTTGEPTRIVYSGFPKLTGTTLLEKRAQASREYDHIRRRLMLEPRGHQDMYGAILVEETEHVIAGKADMGVLFMHNDGFSMMCGHATIALGRFLVDAEESVFPRRNRLKFDPVSSSFRVNLHVPSGILELNVPALSSSGKSDPSRLVSFVSVPSFATGISVQVPLTPENRWPELGNNRSTVTANFSYGGAFYCLVDAKELGFADGLANVDIGRMSHATKLLKAAVNTNPDLAFCTKHPNATERAQLYSVMITDKNLGCHTGSDVLSGLPDSSRTGETGLCFFANQQIDRSPTGGGVAARVALAYTKGDLAVGEKRVYHSLLSQSRSGAGSFVGSVMEVLPSGPSGNVSSRNRPQVRILVEGQAFYTGLYTAIVEETDSLGKTGFSLNQLEHSQK